MALEQFPSGLNREGPPRVSCWAPSARNRKLCEHYFQLAVGQLLDDAQKTSRGIASSKYHTFIDDFHQGSKRARAIGRLYTHLLREYDVDVDEALSIARAVNESRCIEPLSRDEVWEIINIEDARELARRGCGCGCGGRCK